MKKLLRTFSIFVFIIILQLQEFPVSMAFAQDATTSASNESTQSASPTISYATSSATIVPSVTDTQNPFSDTTTAPIQQSSSQSISQLITNSLGTLQSGVSAIIKQKTTVIPLAKKTFKANEGVSLTVGNATPDQLQVSVTDPQGKDLDTSFIEETSVNSQTTISLKPFTSGFHPGKYEFHITDAEGNTTTQDFTWGVLAINLDKSIYLPQETSQMSMAVLDEKGNMVCDANVSLEITDPAGNKTLLSTATKTIIVNPQCLSHNFTLVPDYQTSYQTNQTGSYSMTLSATTKNGTNTIADSFSVSDSVPFDVTRNSATRIYPANTYPMLFHIKANQDFTGAITENTPANFTIMSYATGSAKMYDSSVLVTPLPNMQEAFGVPALALGKPFYGSFEETQGFGAALTDPKEAALYAAFGLAGHDGLDFALPQGTSVFAADDGTVSLAGDGAYGTTVVIDHSWGRSYYGHLSKLSVKVGDKVVKGQEIALSGNTGLSTGAHLHFGIKPMHPDMQNGFYGKVDPTPYLTFLNQNSNVLSAATTSASTTANKMITWNVSLKKGDVIDLAYSYKAPPISPELYALGPLTFQQADKSVVFQEARQWHIAVDANSTAGPNNCGTAADATGTGAATWSSPNNACSSGNASSNLAGGSSHYLKITNFGFTSGQIPTGSKIIGIQFTVTVRGATAGTTVTDNRVRDVKGGTIDSGNDHSSATNWRTVTSITYGTTSDLWGQTWTDSDVTSSTFGVAISGKSGTGSIATIGAHVTATITFNAPPNAPSQDAPANGATVSTTPAFQMTATDPESDSLRYKVIIYSNVGCTTVVQTNDETVSQTGWSGQNATITLTNDAYTSGTQATYTTQSALTAATQYWWTANAIDPSGSNTFVASSTCNTFTTASAGPTLDQLMRHGQWFNNGVIQPFTF